jgi:hypothetical protein
MAITLKPRLHNLLRLRISEKTQRDQSLKCGGGFKWRARQDSNLWPLPSEGSALSS